MLGETESHDESLEALKVRVPEPVLVTLTVAGDGSVPPRMALNETDAGFTERDGAAGTVTVKVTVIMAGEFGAAALTVIWPV